MEKTGFHENFTNSVGKAVIAEFFWHKESEPSGKQILYLPEGSEIIHDNRMLAERAFYCFNLSWKYSG